MDNTEEAIKLALEKIPEKATTEQWKGETPWTVAVKEALVSVGREFGCLTAANGCESDEGQEWLYDVVWFKSDNSGYMTDVPLVAESEWAGESAIKFDFDKLLVSRSKYRVMIFQGDSEDHVLNLIEKMNLWILNFHNTADDDRYLFAGWAKDHWVFANHPTTLYQ